MEICTIGFTQKSAAAFFGALRQRGIRQLVDVRLHNASQLAGFSKKEDLSFFLRELCGAAYRHEPLLAPTQDLLDGYRKGGSGWEAYAEAFVSLIVERQIDQVFPPAFFAEPSVLLCSEATAEKCHRRLVAEYLRLKWCEGGQVDTLQIVHL